MSTGRAFATYVMGNTVALLSGLLVAYIALLHAGDISTLTIRTGDFVQYYAVSDLIVHGHGGHIYDLQRLSGVEARIVYPLSVQHGVLPFLYPPYFALLVAWLAVLPYAAAYSLCLLVNCLCLSAVMFVAERQAGLTGRAAAVLRFGTMCSLPVLMTLALGQVSLLIVAALTATFVRLRAGRDGLAGCAIAFALIKPPYVAPFVLMLLLLGRWRALATCVATTGVLLGVPMVILGPGIDRAYGDLLLAATRWQGQSGQVLYQHVVIAAATYAPQVNQSLAGFWQLLLPASTASRVTLLSSAAALCPLVVHCLRSRDVTLAYGLAAAAAVLINPHVLVHDLCLLILPTAIALGLRHRRPLAALTVATLYLAITAGYGAVHAVPVQFSVLGTTLLVCWLALPASVWRLERRRSAPLLASNEP